jgi:CRP-like cAMP-binding protein
LDIASPNPLSNTLLAALPGQDFELLKPHMVVAPEAQGTVLCEVDHEVDQVHFPVSGMISLVVVMRDGKAIETATVGREGVFGAMAGLGLHTSHVRAIIQLGGTTCRVAASQFRKATTASKALSDLCIGYNEVLLSQARITAACNALHPVEARFSRWLLQTRDRAERDTITLTQEFLSEMLGVRRTTVTEVASKFQKAGVISYSRGVIKIIDLPALQAISCECYQTLQDQTHEKPR